MSGETNLSVLLNSLSCKLHDEVFVFATLADREVPDGLGEIMRFQETEGTTLILTEAAAKSHALPYAFRCRMITLDVHSSLEAVGFIARIATVLADAGMGVNPVAGFYHDHLFVPVGRERDALRLLDDLRRDAGSE
ncbi:MAG: ACT domain-containing protein [Pseudomonadota bacterium]